jgi:hypothetical protein
VVFGENDARIVTKKIILNKVAVSPSKQGWMSNTFLPWKKTEGRRAKRGRDEKTSDFYSVYYCVFVSILR